MLKMGKGLGDWGDLGERIVTAAAFGGRRSRRWLTSTAQSALGNSRAPDGSKLCSSAAKIWKRFTVTNNEGLSLLGDEDNFIFVEGWQDTTKFQGFEAFCRATDAWLVGLGVTTEGREPRRIRATGDVDGVQVVGSVATVPAGDWICGILLHIPAIDIVGAVSGDRKTSVKCLTVCAIMSGLSEPQMQVFNSQLPWTISNELGGGDDDGNNDNNNNDNGIRPNGTAHLRSDEMAIDHVLWSQPATLHFTRPYYNNHSLRIVNYDARRADAELLEVGDDLAPHEVLLWAADASEIAQLKRVFIFIAYSDEVDKTHFGMFDICGLAVEYLDCHPDEGRLVGRMGEGIWLHGAG
ncbi:hypothetical protein MCOR25_006373 [Pyricularia grisea]|nr:hypothetical protein MCOR25_006373 [Pyricularia grisea]